MRSLSECVYGCRSDGSIPPVLRDPALARATYERIEGEVEVGVRASEARQKAFSKDKGEDKGKDDKGKQSQ